MHEQADLQLEIPLKSQMVQKLMNQQPKFKNNKHSTVWLLINCSTAI